MKGKTIAHILQDIQVAKEQYEYLSKLSGYRSFQEVDSKTLLNCYMELFELYYDRRQMDEALYYFSLSKRLIVHYGQCEEITRFVHNAVKKVIFTKMLPDTKYIIENFISISISEKNYELLSLCYLVLSHIHVDEKAFDLALNEAKMAYFYAKQLPPDEQAYVLCQSQLQLMTLAIATEDIKFIEYYIQEFEWTSEKACDVQELFFVKIVEAMLYMLKGDIEQGVDAYEKILPILLHNAEVIHAIQLTEQLQTVLAQVKNLLEPNMYKRLDQQCEKILMKYKVLLNKIESSYDRSMLELSVLLENELIDSQNIFAKGQFFYEKAKGSSCKLLCLVTNIELLQLPMADKASFTEQLKLLHHYIDSQQYFICQYDEAIFVLVAIIQDEKIEKFINEFFSNLSMDQPTIAVMNPQEDGGAENFHQLFSLAYYKLIFKEDQIYDL